MNTWLSGLIASGVIALGLTAIVGEIVMPNPPAWFGSLAIGCLTGLLGYLTPSPLQRNSALPARTHTPNAGDR